MTRATPAALGVATMLLFSACSPAASTSVPPAVSPAGSAAASLPSASGPSADPEPTPGDPSAEGSAATPITDPSTASQPPATAGGGASTPGAATPGAARAADAVPAFRAAVAAQADQMRDTSTIPSAALEQTHTSAALAFYEDLARDLKERGYRLTGEYRVVSAELASGGEYESRVAACIDYANHGMVDSDGKPLTRKQKRYDKGVYVMRWWQDGWKLSATEPGTGPSDSC